ncbi:MAG: Gfo/Idh/MocA family oxidoreductase [Thermoguttaceae bacterium]|nr:Gfo/Idh/MocA family oxidoreductase [Thermoguttaceae bacterium]MDW8077611.1 Gfo/Idh/MocA family oxidoreductase [Thermoguttaceae bacterium]
MTTGVVRIGVLGCARIVPKALVEPASRFPEAQVVAIASRSRQKAERFAQRWGIPRVHSRYEDVLADPDVDAIYNPLPNSLHAEWSIRAMEAGKDVLCEKPIAANAAEAERMAEVAARTGRLLVEALHSRYHPLLNRLKEIVTSGEIGKLRYVEGHLCVPAIFPDPVRYTYELGGGAVMDVGCYPIHLCRFIVGEEPEVVSVRMKLHDPQVDRWTEAILRFPNGVEGRIVCSLFSLVLLRSRAKIVGSDGYIRVFNPYAPQTVYHNVWVKTPAGTRREKFPGLGTYDHQLRAFVRAVKTRETLPTGPADFIANMRVIDAIYQKAGLKPRGMP